MAQNNWEADKMLDVYIYDYLLKRNLQNSAKAFMAEGKVAADPVAIDAPGGFLFEWWSVFWDIFIARTNEKHSDVAAAYIEAQQVKAREHQQQMQMQQLQIMQQRQAQLQRRDAGHPSFTGSVNGMGSESLLGQSTASVLAAKMYEERMKHPNSMDPESSSQLDANRMALLKSSTNQGQLVQGTPGNLSATLQQIQAQTQQMPDMKSDANLIASQRPLPMDASIYAPRLLHSKAGLGSPGLNEGASGLPLKGWPLTVTGLDQLRPNLGQQKSFIQTPNQFQLLTAQQQHQLLAQAQVHGNIGPAGSANFSDMDPRRFRMSQRSGLNGKDGQSANEGSIGSSIGSPKIRAPSQDQAELLMKMQHSSAQQQQSGQLQLQQLQQSNRKRKQHSSSGAVNSTGTGNTAGPSPTSAPSTPSTHTPGDGLPVAGSMHVNSMCRSTIMCGADGPGGLASSSNQLEDMEHFGDGCLEDNVESFLSPHDDADPSLFGTLKRSPMDHNADSSKGFTFLEVGCLRSSSNKVVCCHFSSDGKLLASAGHEKKVVLWNMDTLKTESTPEEHDHLITDIRFKPGSSHLATSSFDRTVRLWNAADPNYCLHVYTGHGSPVMSLDFHPKKTDILCSCEGNGEIRLWSSNQFVCTRVSKHRATAQVRFQPRVGQLLAAADENVVSIFDFEADRRIHALEGHTKEVHSVCWDANGDYLASVSEDSVRVWSLASGGECIHELSSNGNKFHSCVFHPAYPTLLVIGGYQSLELWNMVDNKTMTVAAHEGLIAALAQSPATGMVASASHDKCVKIWK
ncbi:transcriptional corepressor LEUNIG_HOMOLOG-like isoform X2 [Nymphaea colorata]|uniref:transcriptional corepressor LEUNIG_HOMOLOG-like isoform X2 n=1 Tax=Nymphaea colorata TaxID=210225 RepID=UPI00129D2E3D|nr:transcriptional corepressor LEUNIG_HOMOLOG-like isoform X2 [Nymphaea colorata]